MIDENNRSGENVNFDSLKSKILLAQEQYWSNLFSRSSSTIKGFLKSLGLAICGAASVYIVHIFTGHYFPSITILSVIIITLFGGAWFGIFWAIVLSLWSDYLLIPPIGSVLSNIESIEHFIIVTFLSIAVSLIISSLKISFIRKIVVAKESAEYAKKEAEKANKLKSEFISNMSHEIRTPINGIVGMSSLLGKTELNSNQRHYLESIKISSDILLSLIGNVLDLSRVEAGKMELQNVKFDIRDLVTEITNLFVPIAEQRGLQFDCKLTAIEAPFCFMGDKDKIKQVLTNLLGNAIKFTSEGLVTLDITIEPAGSDLQSNVIFLVSDTGIGIPNDVQKNLFQQFFQGNSSTSRKYGGSGLGLAICKQLVELMGGKIGLRQKKDRGTTFYINLNLKSISQLAMGVSKKLPKMIHDSYEKKRENLGTILLAEDNFINQEIVATMLRNAGHKVDTAENGIAVIEAVKTKSYALILMDCQMPDMDGYETTRILRSQGISIPIIALTAHAFTGEREKCLRAGMSDHLSKPISEEYLLQHVNKFLGSQPQFQNSSPNEEGHSKNENNCPLIDARAIERLEFLDRKEQSGLVTKLISYYLDSTPHMILAIKQAAENKDLILLRRESHKLKSSSANLGLVKASDLLEQLEDENTPQKQYPDLIQSLQNTVADSIIELKRLRHS